MKPISMNTIWYGPYYPVHWILRPFSWVFRLISQARRYYLQHFCQVASEVPVIVVGNLTVGGVGKTPLVIALAKKLTEQGLRVGIVSRGYGASIATFPYEIGLDDDARQVGDEPLLLAQKTKCPVVIDPQRAAAVRYLVTHKQSQVIISDDGLQHYRMGRAIEIAVIDGTRGLGNGLCLPAGPLRESASRLKQVDMVVVNQGQWPDAFVMQVKPGPITGLKTGKAIAAHELTGPVAAVAGIGNPQRFYDTLKQLGIAFNPYSYPDHYQFQQNDLNYDENQIIMTEKDAVKCYSFQSDRLYYLPIEAEMQTSFWDALWSHKQLQGIIKDDTCSS